MSSDPRPHTARKADGSLDHDLERRFDELFRRVDLILGEQVSLDAASSKAQGSLSGRLDKLQKAVSDLDARVTALESAAPVTTEPTP